MTAHVSVYFDTIIANGELLEDEPRPMSQTRIRELIERNRSNPAVQGPLARGSNSKDFLEQNGICVGSPRPAPFPPLRDRGSRTAALDTLA